MNFDELALNAIMGIWDYHPDEQTLIFKMSTAPELREKKLLVEDDCLSPAFKLAVKKQLGNTVLANVVGPFGDDDIFSGYESGGQVIYCIELCGVTESNVDALKSIDGVTIRRLVEEDDE